MRRKTFTLGLAVFFVCLFASRAQAQKAAWSEGFPKPGNNAGEILVQGTSQASGGGWSLNGMGSITVWVRGGGNITIKGLTVDKDNGNWSGTITGLTSNQEYNVLITIFEANGGVQRTICPDPGKSKAK